MPRAMSSKEPLPSSSALIGMTFVSGATPATPMPLFVTAAMVPLTWVPWASDSCATPSGPFQPPLPHEVSPQSMNVAPGTRFALRSGCVRSTPESTTATTVPEPVVLVQACSPWIWSRPHCWARSGSLVTALAGPAATVAATRLRPVRRAPKRVSLEARVIVRCIVNLPNGVLGIPVQRISKEKVTAFLGHKGMTFVKIPRDPVSECYGAVKLVDGLPAPKSSRGFTATGRLPGLRLLDQPAGVPDLDDADRLKDRLKAAPASAPSIRRRK